MRPGVSRLWITIVVIQLIITLGVSNALTLRLWDGRISQGAVAASVDIGGLPPSQAAEVLSRSLGSSSTERVLLLTDGENNWSVKSQEIDFSPDFVETAENAYLYDHQGPLPERVSRAWDIRLNQKDFPLKGRFSAEKLHTLLQNIAQMIYREPQPARIENSDEGITIVKELPGRRLNIESSIEKINESFLINQKESITLVVETLLPSVTESDLSGIHEVLAVYTTKYNPKELNRTTNVEIAARTIDGVILKPGEIFSLNASLGPRSKEAGYQSAPIFVNQTLVKGIGGGICQVATTLYNAVLQTKLEIKERWPHSSPIAYAPLGLDATLMGDTADLKFLNTTGAAVYISSIAKEGVLTVTLYGASGENGVSRRIITEKEVVVPPLVVKFDQTLPPGESKVVKKGKAGYRVKVYRITETNGQETSREVLSQDYYRPQPTIINSGDKEVETK